MDILNKAFEEAKRARQRAHAPYSKFQVGAALVTKDGQIYSGCNVENSSYGGTVCAERTAFYNMVANQGKQEVDFIVLVTDPLAVPCALCLQIMSEFCQPDFAIHLAEPTGIQKKVLFSDMLPTRFDPKSLPGHGA